MNIHTKENMTVLSLLGITITIGGLLTIPTAIAGTDALDEITITVPETCSISSTINTAHTATFSAGTWSGAEGSD